jgi:chorismate mutase
MASPAARLLHDARASRLVAESLLLAAGQSPLATLCPRGGHVDLSDWRRRIDEIDRKLVELLNERSRCALELGKLKQEAHLPLYQPDREKEVLENAERANPGPLSDAAIRRLFERIIDEARAAERAAMHPDGEGKDKNL